MIVNNSAFLVTFCAIAKSYAVAASDNKNKVNFNGTRVKFASLLVLSRRGSVDVLGGMWYNKIDKLEITGEIIWGK